MTNHLVFSKHFTEILNDPGIWEKIRPMLQEAERQNPNINPGQRVEYVLGDNIAKEIGVVLTKRKQSSEEQKVDDDVNSKRTTLSNFGQYSDQFNGNESQNASQTLRIQNNIDPLHSSENFQATRLDYVPQQESVNQSNLDRGVWNQNSLDLNKDKNLN